MAEHSRQPFDQIAGFYDELVRVHGVDARSCDYGNRASQQRKFEVLAEVGALTGKRILDVGCGLADYADFLEARFGDLTYVGIDVSPAMVEQARARRPDLDLAVANVLELEVDRPFDVVNANGIFYLLGEHAPELMHLLITRMWEASGRAVAFNSLSAWADRREPGEFQADPLETLAFCRSLTRSVVLRHDYMTHDFTVYLYRENAL
jgi:SAM-dependent methyltransferase